MRLHSRTQQLRRLMRDHGLTPQHVSKLVHRNESYVRSWHAGINIVPPEMLRLLELEIAYARGDGNAVAAS